MWGTCGNERTAIQQSATNEKGLVGSIQFGTNLQPSRVGSIPTTSHLILDYNEVNYDE